MPQQNMTSRLGNSPSPVLNKVLNNNKNVQQPCPVNSATAGAYNKQPVTVPVK